MKKILFSLLLAAASLPVMADQIASLEQTASWVNLYNAQGRKYKSLSTSSVGRVVGYSSSIFISETQSWIYIYDSDGRKIKTMSRSTVGDIIGVAGDTFTSRSGSWIYTWSKDGRKIGTRSAH